MENLLVLQFWTLRTCRIRVKFGQRHGHGHRYENVMQEVATFLAQWPIPHLLEWSLKKPVNDLKR